MRSFQLIYLLTFLVFYSFISFSSISILRRLVQKNHRKRLSISISLFSIFIILSFVFLYVWPLNTRKTGEYSFYLIYNAILSFDFIFKIPFTFTFISGLFIAKKSYSNVIYFIGLIISLSLGSSIIYGTLIGRNNLSLKHVEIKFKNLPSNFNNFKIVQFSDIHLGSINSHSLLKKVQMKTEDINPDLIIFTGDLVNNFSSELEGWSEIFQNINKRCNSFSILGNHDYGDYSSWESDESKAENFNNIVAAHNLLGFKLLRNENAVLKSGNDSIYLVGVENWGHPPFPQYANLGKAMKGVPGNSFKILLSHDPAYWESVIKNIDEIELTLSGHSHGLQWGIFKAGIQFSLSYLTRKKWGGLYNDGNSKLYVNLGLGTVGIPWRINMPPELTVITLKRVEID